MRDRFPMLSASLVVFTLILAGCTSDPGPAADDADIDDEDHGLDGHEEEGHGADGNATSGGNGTDDDNATLEANLTASVTNGTAPLNVTFTVNATGTTGNVTWSLDLDGDGAADIQGNATPAEVNHTFDTGNHTITLTVVDEVGNATTNVTIAVAEGGPAQPTFETLTFTGSATGAWAPGAGYVGSKSHTFDLAAIPSKMTVTLSWGTTAVDLDIDILAPDGSEAGSAASFNEPTGLVFGTGEEVVIDDAAYLSQLGTWTIVVKPAVAAQGSYTVTVTFEE